MNNVFFMKHSEGNIIENGIPTQHHVVDRIGNNNMVFVKEKHNNQPTIRYIERPHVRFQQLPFVKLSNKIDRMPTPYTQSKRSRKSKKTTKGKKQKNKNTRKSSKKNKAKK
jgi:hypothetical protein